MPKLHLVLSLECSFLQNTSLFDKGNSTTTIFDKIVEYISGFCDCHIRDQDTISISLLNDMDLPPEQGNTALLFQAKEGNKTKELQQIFLQIKARTPPSPSKPFSLVHPFTICNNLLQQGLCEQIVLIHICSSSNYQPSMVLKEQIETMQKTSVIQDGYAVEPVVANIIDFKVNDSNELQTDCLEYGFNYFSIGNEKDQLSTAMAQTLFHLLKPVIPNKIIVIDTNILMIDDKQTNLLFSYALQHGFSLCFPRRVLQELDGLKNRENLRRQVTKQQRKISTLGSLRYSEDLMEVKKFVKKFSNNNLNCDEEIILTAKFIQESVCPVILASNDIGMQTLCGTYNVATADLDRLLKGNF